eukprot:203998-Pelagomonas_calceolata.AAC.2
MPARYGPLHTYGKAQKWTTTGSCKVQLISCHYAFYNSLIKCNSLLVSFSKRFSKLTSALAPRLTLVGRPTSYLRWMARFASAKLPPQA